MSETDAGGSSQSQEFTKMRANLWLPAGVGHRHSDQSYLDLKGRVMPGFLDQRSQIPSSQEHFHISGRICHRREMYENGRGKHISRERPVKEKEGLVVNRLRGSYLGKE